MQPLLDEKEEHPVNLSRENQNELTGQFEDYKSKEDYSFISFLIHIIWLSFPKLWEDTEEEDL
jgi:hypothetical protein